MASNNMYRVGDFVYFESSATAPYQIRRIDELNKTPTGAVEAKVACYYRRRDVSIALINQAEKYYVSDTDSDEDSDNGKSGSGSSGSGTRRGSAMSELDKHRIKHRELFLSRQIECLPATHIRGKCSVTLYNEAEPLSNYLVREDAFYYKLIYDPSLKTLQEDRGAMRIGSDHQSEIQPHLKDPTTDPRLKEHLEELVWKPASISDEEIELFCTLTRAVGTLGRAYDNSSTTRSPLLSSAAAAAGRDITKQYAYDLLHQANYDLKKAIALLLPSGQPVICRDQLEEWSASEAHLFEEALDKYSKVFPDILSDYLPWKTHKSLVELYYFWKTTDRYVRQRRTKLAAQEHKLKQVYIPNYSKPNPAVLYNGTDKVGRGCEGCGVAVSSQWYAWGPQNLLYRLCTGCWSYWKRYGGLKNLASKERAAALRSPNNSTSPADTGTKSGSESHEVNPDQSHPSTLSGPAPHPVGINTVHLNQPPSLTGTPNTAVRYADGLGLPAALVGGPRGTQCFRTPTMIRLARILCPDIIRPSLLARRPGKPAISTGLKRILTAANRPDAADNSNTALFTALRTTVHPILARIRDPKSLLTCSKRMPPLNDVIKNIATSKGITLHRIDLNSVTKSNHSNGSPVPTKRPRSPSADKLNGSQSTVCNQQASTDLINGGPVSSKLGSRSVDEDSVSPPPCKKPTLTPSNPVEVSNGLSLSNGPAAVVNEKMRGNCL
ncbi:unnamed protein product [Calicophoron daubneyi]|uniref:Uncharacterized protein n=1 Tax=Calicophoron daubneyi TaxID=300641 RepID=A0AAV2T4M7_CALDB